MSEDSFVKIIYSDIGNMVHLGHGINSDVYHVDMLDGVIKVPINSTLEFQKEYDEDFSYILLPRDKIEIKKFRKLKEITDRLTKFIKIKGFVIFANVSSEKGMLKSVIYENLGELDKNWKIDSHLCTDLLVVLDEMLLLNQHGFIHADTLMCNNLERRISTNMFVIIDMDGIQYYDDSMMITYSELFKNLLFIIKCLEIRLNKLKYHHKFSEFGHKGRSDYSDKINLLNEDFEVSIDILIRQSYREPDIIPPEPIDMMNRLLATIISNNSMGDFSKFDAIISEIKKYKKEYISNMRGKLRVNECSFGEGKVLLERLHHIIYSIIEEQIPKLTRHEQFISQQKYLYYKNKYLQLKKSLNI